MVLILFVIAKTNKTLKVNSYGWLGLIDSLNSEKNSADKIANAFGEEILLHGKKVFGGKWILFTKKAAYFSECLKTFIDYSKPSKDFKKENFLLKLTRTKPNQEDKTTKKLLECLTWGCGKILQIQRYNFISRCSAEIYERLY